jgi:hypothetical protein
MRRTTLLVTVALVLVGCREADGPLGGVTGQLQVFSDPPNARVFIDSNPTNFVTPDTIFDISGAHDVFAVLDSAGAEYTYFEHVNIRGIEPYVMSGPLTANCKVANTNQQACYARNRLGYQAGNMTFSLNVTGAMLTDDGNGKGLLWPATSNDSYVSTAMPLISAKVGDKPVALGMYDIPSLEGRPVLSATNIGNALESDQRSWIVPLAASQAITTMRGIEVREQVLIDPSVPDVALIKLTYRNITNSPSYQKLDTRAATFGAEGLTYNSVYLGFGIDPDIGTATDDAVTYDPALHGVFAYDANFADPQLGDGQPGMIGLRMLSAPSGAPIILGNYQGSGGDWHAGEITETNGWGVMSGTATYAPDDPDPAIGTLVANAGDVRMFVSAGPYALRPAEEITIVVAIALARPVTGTFTPGTTIAPGDPHDATRPIMATAASLHQKLTDAMGLLPRIISQ